MDSLQPFLFDLPESEVVECIRNGRYTGKISGRLEDRAAQIVRLVLLRCSKREIARQMSCDPRTVDAVFDLLEGQGKLPTLKQRLSEGLGEIAQLASENLRARLLSDDVPSNVLPIVLGVCVDKKLLLDGDATVRVERVDVELTQEELVRRLKTCGQKGCIELQSEEVQTATGDTQSIGLVRNPEQIQDEIGSGYHEGDRVESPGGSEDPVRPSGPAGPGGAGAGVGHEARAEAKEGGEGVADGRGPMDADGLELENL